MQLLYIKNMVCDRCKRVVQTLLEACGLTVLEIALGSAKVAGYDDASLAQQNCLKERLEAEGFELLEDRKAQLVAEIKTHILTLIRSGNLPELKENLSDFLSQATGKDYHTLTATFSALETVSIERYFILQKVELLKEWLAYAEIPLKEMAYKLGYSSVAYLTNQFKQVTGFTPSAFRKLKAHPRKPLDKVGS